MEDFCAEITLRVDNMYFKYKYIHKKSMVARGGDVNEAKRMIYLVLIEGYTEIYFMM